MKILNSKLRSVLTWLRDKLKTIVAGGAGFIGSVVFFHIINNINDNVSVVDCLR